MSGCRRRIVHYRISGWWYVSGRYNMSREKKTVRQHSALQFIAAHALFTFRLPIYTRGHSLMETSTSTHQINTKVEAKSLPYNTILALQLPWFFCHCSLKLWKKVGLCTNTLFKIKKIWFFLHLLTQLVPNDRTSSRLSAKQMWTQTNAERRCYEIRRMCLVYFTRHNTVKSQRNIRRVPPQSYSASAFETTSVSWWGWNAW